MNIWPHWFLLVFLACSGLTIIGGGADFTLTVFGNANLDDLVDAEDIEYLKGILNGTRAATEFADANYDGKVDEADIDQVQAIINRTEDVLSFKETSGRIVSLKMPVEKVSLLTPEHSEGMRWLKAQDMVVGVTQKWERDRPEYFPELSKKPIVGSFFEPNYEAIIDQGSDLVFTWSSWTSPGAEEMQEKLDPAGVAVVGLDLYRPTTFTNEVKIMGMILHKEDEADQFINFYQSKTDDIKERVGSVPPEQRKIVYYEYMKPYNTFGSSNELAEVFDTVGARGAFDNPVERFDVSAEDVVVRNPDIIP
jgi:iron complex transport system substrate-binding protein